jgi:Domain of unknown function (DUF4157)
MAFAQHQAPTTTADTPIPVKSRARVGSVLKSPGRSLDAATRARMELLFGFDFSQVRVHDDASAAESAASLGARAFAVGPHIVFGRGEHAPGTSAGARLMAHELAHVVQQRGQPLGDPASLAIGNTRDGAESSAHHAAQQVTAGHAAGSALVSDAAHSRPAIRRWSTDDISINLTPRNVRQDIEPTSPDAREPVWCQFGGADRGDECRPIPACKTSARSTWDFVAIFRVDGAPPASPLPAAARSKPIDIEGSLHYEPNNGPTQDVGTFTANASYRGQGQPVFRQRISFSSADDGVLGVMLKVGTDLGVVIHNGGVPCERVNCI